MWEVMLIILVVAVVFGGLVSMVLFFLSLLNALIKNEAAEKELQEYNNKIYKDDFKI